jgi:hypothetical protein
VTYPIFVFDVNLTNPNLLKNKQKLLPPNLAATGLVENIQ